MTIKTLTYIHQLLKAEEKRTAETYKAARDLQYEYEERGVASPELVQDQKKAADEFMRDHSRALDALLEFERQEW